MQTDPTPEHAWLKQLVGAWTYEHSCPTGPGEEPAHLTGTESVRMLGDLWVIGEMEGEVPGGGRMTGVITLGYDPARGKFIGTWIGSVMASMFVYEGALDEAGWVLTLDTTGPSFKDPTRQVRYQDIVELREDGSRVLRSRCEEEGAWHEFMQGTYRRAD